MTINRKISTQLWQVLLFVVIFGLLQHGWTTVRPAAIGQFVIEGVTVKFAVALINLITPSVAAVAQGTHISALGGGINVINGCEGIEVMLLLAAAMAIAPIGWRVRLTGLGLGAVLVFLLNQVRLIAMFYAVRADRAVFDMLHGMVAPILLIALTGLFFSWWIGRHASGPVTDGSTG
jgi:exosortase/archaeosortase family protein